MQGKGSSRGMGDQQEQEARVKASVRQGSLDTSKIEESPLLGSPLLDIQIRRELDSKIEFLPRPLEITDKVQEHGNGSWSEMGDQRQQEGRAEASCRHEIFESNLVHNDIPEAMKPSPIIVELQPESMQKMSQMKQGNSGLDSEYQREIFLREMVVQVLSSKSETAATEKQASGHSKGVQGNETVASEIQASGLTGRVQEHGIKAADLAPKLLAAKNAKGDTALHVAAKKGHISTLNKLLAAYLPNIPSLSSETPNEILTKNNQGNTFLHEVISHNHSQEIVMNFLVSEEYPPYFGVFKEVVVQAALLQINKDNKSVLYLAIEAGYKEVVDQILAKLDSLRSALNHLIKKYPEVKELNLHRLDVPPGISPLVAAITNQDQDILDIILKRRSAWIHLRDTKGRTPLHYAASIGFLEGVQYLLGRCASFAIERDNDGFYPVHLASYGGHVKVIKELLKSEFRLDPREILDNGDRNILHLAVVSGKFDVVKYILNDPDLGKMINDQDAEGNTALHMATLCRHPKIVHALTWDKRVELNLINGDYHTALDFCGQSSEENSSYRELLTRAALKSARARNAKPLPIKFPPLSVGGYWKKGAPGMDHQDNNKINNLMVISTLIMGVTFAAGFTMPGGTNSSDSDPGRGMALLLNRMWFKLFIFCITISMYGAISVTIMLVWAQIGDETLVPLAFNAARYLLGVILVTLGVAFLAGVHLVISDLSWLATTFLVMGVIFVLMLMVLYIAFWHPWASSIQVFRVISYYPFVILASLVDPQCQW